MFFTEKLREAYDIIVTGAGPAGIMAAWHAAKGGAKVLLLEKNREIGVPVRCAEGVEKLALENLIGHPAKPRWVATAVDTFCIYAPDGRPISLNFENAGYILNRNNFEFDLAGKAVEAGARLITSAAVSGVLKTDGGMVSGVLVNFGGEEMEVRGRIVIAADGVESRVARFAGIESVVAVKDIASCAQYTITGLEVDPHTCHFYFSWDHAPGFYAWLFPKGANRAHLGLGVTGNFAKNKSPAQYLDGFLSEKFPGVSVVAKTIGGVPIAKPLKKIVSDSFMVVGDAARQANPLSGGGIISGMIAGKLAGETAARAVNRGDTSEKALLPYAREWHKRVGKNYQRFYRLRNALLKYGDENFNEIVGEFLKLTSDKKNLMNLFKTAFKSHPTLFIDIFKSFSPLKEH